VLCLLAAIASAHAGDGISGPVSGFVVDARSSVIRPILGIPGAATLGPAINLPVAVETAAFAGRAFAIAANTDGDLFLVQQLAAVTPDSKPIDGVQGPVSRMALNAAQTAAVAYSRDRRSLQLITGLPTNPQISQPIDVSALEGEVTALALGNDAVSVLAGTTTVDSGFVYLVHAPGSLPDGARLLARLQSAAAIALVHNGKDAFIADRAANSIIYLRDLEGSADVIPWADASTGVATPTGLCSLGGDQLLVANAALDGTSVSVIDATSSLVRQIPLSANPTRCDSLDGAGTLVLNDPGDSPLLLVDTTETLRVAFVPVDRL
jgi:hypothetical protein